MRTTRRLPFVLLAFCIVTLLSSSILIYWVSRTQYDPLRFVPLYPGAYNVVNDKKWEQRSSLGHQMMLDTWYVVEPKEGTINDFYEDRLLNNGWEPATPGGSKMYPGSSHAYDAYVAYRTVPAGIEFTGFDGPMLGAPWLRTSVANVTHYLAIDTHPDVEPPTESIDSLSLPRGNVRVMLSHVIDISEEP